MGKNKLREVTMLTILIGRAKTGKSDTMLRRMAELGESSQQILLVPEHASHQAEVDVCSACGDTASRHAEVLSFRRLGERVLSITGGIADVTLDNGGKLLTLQRALLETAPQMTVYRKPSQKVGFLEQMLALFDELRSYEVTPEILYQQAQDIDGATHDKLTDLSLLYAAYEARLRRPGLDARDRMTKLCDHLEESGYVRGKDIFIDGFTYFNAQERRALAIFLRQARSVTVTLLGEVNSREEIFEPTLKTMSMLERLAASEGKPVKLLSLTNEDPSALGHLERHFFGENLPYEGDSTVIRLREAATVYSILRGRPPPPPPPPSAGGGEVPLSGHHRGGPEYDGVRRDHRNSVRAVRDPGVSQPPQRHSGKAGAEPADRRAVLHLQRL